MNCIDTCHDNAITRAYNTPDQKKAHQTLHFNTDKFKMVTYFGAKYTYKKNSVHKEHLKALRAALIGCSSFFYT